MKLLKSETAAAEVIGHVIILFITILGISMIALYGVPAIYSLEDMANSKNSEQAFTVLDSRASRVTLGESPLQITNINLGGGTLTVEPNSPNHASYMVVKDQNNTFNVTIPMGKIKYQLGDRIVAYEDGGVWAQYPGGGTVMLSPPEVHFDGVTLTLPVFYISGNSSVGGKGTAVVSFKKNATLVQYPNTTCLNCTNRTNPVNYTGTGKVFVNITSDYYLAWANYARSLGYINVSNDTTHLHTTSMELRVIPSWLGENTSIWEPIPMRGLNTSDPEPLKNFSFRIYSSDISKINWDIRAKSQSGNKRLIFHITATKTYATINVGYEDDTAGKYNDPAETWEGANNLFPVQGVAPNQYVEVNLLNKSINLTYTDVPDIGTTSGCSGINKIEKKDFNNTGFSWTDRKVNTTSPYNSQSLYNITQHYIQLMAQEGDISFYQCSPSDDNHAPGPASTMLINYNAIGALTYLHITENRADVTIS